MFIEIDEPFICENCGNEVKPLGYSSRNHCPKCLYSKHVDKEPGDRAEECRGMLKPIGMENSPKKGYIIIYKCEKCGAIRRNKMAKDDNFDLLLDIVKNNSYKMI